jgi:hypothetical protein
MRHPILLDCCQAGTLSVAKHRRVQYCAHTARCAVPLCGPEQGAPAALYGLLPSAYMKAFASVCNGTDLM